MSSDLVILVLCFFPMVYVSNFLHELGHAVMAWRSGYVVTSFGLGVAHPFCVWNWAATRVYFCRTRPAEAITFVYFPRIFPSRRQSVGMYAGGSLAHLLVTVTALILWRLLPWGGNVWLLTAAYNAFAGLANLIPLTIGVGSFTLRTDGALILQALRDSTLEFWAPQTIRRVAGLRGLWEAIGDTVILRIGLLHAALAWLGMGEKEQAQSLCAEAEKIPAERAPFLEAYEALVRALVAVGGGDLAEGGKSLDRAERLFAALHDEAGLFCVRLGRASLLFHQGHADAAVTLLDSLASHPLVDEQPTLQAALLVCRFEGAETLSAEKLELLRTEYEAARRRHLSLTNTLYIDTTLAQAYVRQQDWERAEAAFREALEAVRKLHKELAEPADQERFLKCQAQFLAQAKDCLRHLGKEEEAANLEQLYFSPEAKKRRQTEDEKQRDLRCYWRGILLTGFNFACVLGSLGLGWAQRGVRPNTGFEPDWLQMFFQLLKPFPGIWVLLCTLLGLFGCVSAMYGLFFITIGHLSRSWSRDHGLTILLLAIAPWGLTLTILGMWFGIEIWEHLKNRYGF